MGVELRLLSQVAFRGQEIPGRRTANLLAVLAADLRAGASAARLVDELWPDDRPEHPAKALQVLVSRGRARLGADVVLTTPTGYRLGLDAAQVDAVAVLRAAADAARLARDGDHAGALAATEAGLALGPTAPDDGGDALAGLRSAAVSARASLSRDRALALARLGRAAEAVPLLTALAPRHDEEVLAALLRAEAATAGPAAALARYETHRRRLRDELGADPGPALQALHRDLLREQAPRGVRGMVHEPNPLRGRDADLAAVLALLHRSRVTSVVGPGGLGKTRLAYAVARRAEQRMVHVVGLAGLPRDGDVTAAVVSAVGAADRSPRTGRPVDPVSAIVDALGSRALLVLDNCEHVLDGVADLVAGLVARSADLRVLATSRAPLGLSSESVHALPELDLDTSAALFVERALAARPAADLPAAAVRALCTRLDGLPLAVELAAARTRTMTVDEIARRLDDRFALLRTRARDVPERHRTLHAVVDWSWTLLDPAAQRALAALAVFPGGFTAAAAEYLVDDADLLEHLVEQSLVGVVDTPHGTRFRILETVREFARADDDGPAVDGLLAWARAYGLAQHPEPLGPDPFRAGQRIRVEQDNLVLALDHALDRGDGDTVAAVAAVLAALWTSETDPTARVAGLADRTAHVLSHLKAGPEVLDAVRTVSALGTLTAFLLRGPCAVRSLVTLRRLPPAPPDTLARALASVLRGSFGPEGSGLDTTGSGLEAAVAGVLASYAGDMNGDHDGALAAARRALDGLDGSVPWLGLVVQMRLSELSVQSERGADATAHAAAGLAILEAAGADQETGGVWWVGLLAAQAGDGDPDRAEALLEQVAPVEAELDAATLSYLRGVRGEIHLTRGEVDAGLACWREAVAACDDHPTPGYDAIATTAWTGEVRAVAVVAHARHGRLDEVADVADELVRRLVALLDDPGLDLPAFLFGLPVLGAQLLGVAAADLARGDGVAGARLTALAERLHFLRNFQPTMAGAPARAAAERADGPAHAHWRAVYAGLTPADARAAAQDALRSRADPMSGRDRAPTAVRTAATAHSRTDLTRRSGPGGGRSRSAPGP